MAENTCNCKPQIEGLQILCMTLQQEFLILRSALLKTNFEDEMVDFETKLQMLARTDFQLKMIKAREEAMREAEFGADVIGASDDAA